MDKRLTLLVDRIKDLDLFRGLHEPDVTRIAQTAHMKNVRGGDFFFFQDEPADRVFVLLEGSVKLSKSIPGEGSILLRMIRPTAVFAAVAMAQVDAYPVSAQAIEDSQAAYWNRTDIIPLIAQYPQLALNALHIIAVNTQEFQERLAQLATERVERRLARTLIRLASQAGKKVEEGILIDLSLTRQDLAEMSGTTLYTVSRTLSAWESQGLVLSGRERVVICAPHGLVRIAEDLPALTEDE